ncbi:O-succinylbenzoic acid--CoA ligase [Microterricola gilva]|uniref:O-succinylbenzoic acid--CoA ligase n=1 Tax=Microterricola gilva TaxID=393267 RepID=A0A4Q8APR3_9MICO|nr:AMP-binding protein [Microterricola gilva]RZU66680.1 O-succinylbenzoic acid--CoA ligase [Microterricola gilva]
MTRPLRVIDGGSALEVLEALRAALAGAGPAVLPLPFPLVEPHPPVELVETTGETVPKRVALVIETSGSTGVPKRVALSTDALLASAAASAAALGGPGQWLLALPTHYIAGAQVLVRSIAAETESVILPGGHFDPRLFAEYAARLDAPLRFVSLVPVQLARVVEAAESDGAVLAAARRFDRILVGGQATPPALIARAAALGLRVTRTYGSSETAGGCVYDGVPLHGTEVRIVGGLIELGGPTLAEGYLDDEERTAAAFVEGDGRRWYRTGDLGEVADGKLRVLGRSDNVIISGGEKISLDAVERVLHTLPGFEGAVAVAVPDAQWGQSIVVACERADTADAAPSGLDAVRAHVASALGNAARPRAVHSFAALPRLASGKPDRVGLAALLDGRMG